MICRPVFVWSCGFPVCGVACKGVWWMPWQTGPMKDVAGSDMPRGAAELALILGFLNGVTRQPSWAVTAPCGAGGTQGSETSQYLQERIFRE